MTQALKIAKENYDAKTAPSDKLLLNSDQECIKVSSKIIDNITTPYLTYPIDEINYLYWTGYKDYYHNLNCVPAVRIFTNEGSNVITEAPYAYQEPYTESGPFVGFGYYLNCYVDDQKVRVNVDAFYIYADLPSITVNYILFIFANPINIEALPRVSSEGPWLDRTYGDLTFGG